MTKKFPRKILYSPGYGAGWSSWCNDEYAQFIAEYDPIIELLEKDPKAFEKYDPDHTDNQYEKFPILRQLIKDIRKEFSFNKDPYVFFGGVHQLKVKTVYGPYRVDDYDGSESVEEQGSMSGWNN